MLHQSARAGNIGNAKKYLIGAGNAKAGIDAIDKSVIIKRLYSSRLCALLFAAVDRLVMNTKVQIKNISIDAGENAGII